MKAISLWQPWATAIAVGSKTIETRSWGTHYRGPIAIHAAKRMRKGELISYSCSWNWMGALAPTGLKMHGDKRSLWELIPFGAIVAVADLADCRPTHTFALAEIETPRRPAGEHGDLYKWTERQMGDFSLGRFGWVLKDVRPLVKPLPWKGEQGWFDVPDDLIAQHLQEDKDVRPKEATP